ncbi:MAG: hypothetical protein LUE89_01540 [Clostridiales bacterium]|nr:hypothetical protein [Clostridiales bacterium]
MLKNKTSNRREDDFGGGKGQKSPGICDAMGFIAAESFKMVTDVAGNVVYSDAATLTVTTSSN